MNWSAELVTLVPPTVVTVTCMVPDPAGATAATEVGELTLKLTASVEPNLTELAPLRLVPVTVTGVPAASGPCTGEIPLTVGAGTNVNSSCGPVALVPPVVVTVTFTVPVPAGAWAVIEPSEFTWKLVAPVEPNMTAATSMKWVPVIETLVAPDAGPSAGLTPVTVGGGGLTASVAPWAPYVGEIEAGARAPERGERACA